MDYQLNPILQYFCPLFLIMTFLFASSLNAYALNPNIRHWPGWKSFHQGCQYFDEGNLEKAIPYFSQTLETCYKPYFICDSYCGVDEYLHGDRRESTPCEESYYSPSRYRYDNKMQRPDSYGYMNLEPTNETAWSIYRHTHFYLGLIYLQYQEFSKADFHFHKSIGFGEDDIGLLFYQCINFIDPFWAVCASLTQLQEGNLKLSKELACLAYLVNLSDFQYFITDEGAYHYWGQHG